MVDLGNRGTRVRHPKPPLSERGVTSQYHGGLWGMQSPNAVKTRAQVGWQVAKSRLHALEDLPRVTHTLRAGGVAKKVLAIRKKICYTEVSGKLRQATKP